MPIITENNRQGLQKGQHHYKEVKMLRKGLYVVIPLIMALILAISLPVFAQPTPVPCTNEGACGQVKVVQVPFPWQFWAYTIDETSGNVTSIIDKIRISPTWLNPPPGQPAGEGKIFVTRWWALVNEPIELEALVWEFDDNGIPSLEPPRNLAPWEPLGTNEVKAGEDLIYEFLLPDAGIASGAAFIAYEVRSGEDEVAAEVVGHFLNELALLPQPVGSPPIIEVRVNFDIHNNTDYDFTNFELDFDGLDFTCTDIENAIGFVVGGDTWGVDPLIVRPIPGGTEVKWVEPCRPIKYCQWLHGGLSFQLNDLIVGDGVTVQGYWTQFRPKVWCVEGVNPHGKNIPPAGWSTLPGRKGGQNEDGFYQLFYCVPPCWPTPDDPVDPKSVKIWVGTKDLGPLFGGYDNEVVIKITEAPGADPAEKKIGSQKGKASAVKSHVTLPSDPVLFLIDVDGNVIARCDECLVPPFPK